MQLWHVPLHALSQHTPSTQKPLEHSLDFVAWHTAPLGFFVVQLPLAVSQYSVLLHCASLRQSEAHAVAWHASGVHVTVPLSWQLPAPSQVLASVLMPFWQDCGAHSVPLAYTRQTPLPLHAPSVP